MNSIPRPDHSDRPFQLTCTYTSAASPHEVYVAWTTKFDLWFAQPGTLSMIAEPGRSWFFYNKHEWGRHPHYGRFLELRENELIETTWITGNGNKEGTEGAETILRIELVPNGSRTEITLTHSGFVSQRSCESHRENWPLALDELDKALKQ